MRPPLHYLLAATLAASIPTLAAAQSGGSTAYGPREGSQELTLSGTGTTDNDFERGSIGVTGSYGYYLSPDLEVGVRQSLNWADTGESSWSGSTRGAIDFHFTTGRLRPFIGANLGMIYGDDVEETGIISPELGVKYYADTNTFAFAMAEYQIFFEDSDDIDSNFGDSAFVYTLGIGFNF